MIVLLFSVLFADCNKCGNPFLSLKSLQSHLQVVHNQLAYKCTISPCNFKHWMAEVMVEHYWEKHGTTEVPEAYRPIEESKRLPWGDRAAQIKNSRLHSLPRRLQKAREEGRTRIRPPGRKGMGKLQTPEVMQHIEILEGDEEGKNKYRCRVCDHMIKQHNKIVNMIDHVKVKHLNFKMNCQESGCSFATGYDWNMIQHLQKVHGKGYIFCTVPGCKFKTMYEEKIQTHQTEVHKAKVTTSINSNHASIQIPCMMPECTFKTMEDAEMQLHLTNVHNARYDEKTHSLVCFA